MGEPPNGSAAVDFATMMSLEPHGPDTFVGVGPRYPWGGLYGGQIVAQSLRAAACTVGDPAYRVHSLHAYFIRRGDADEPIRFEVDRVRNGRSLLTRRVIARQSVGAILSMSASFAVEETGPDVQTARLPEVPPPDALVQDSWSDMFERALVPTTSPGRRAAWFRIRPPLDDDPVLHATGLAYLSDDLPTEAVMRLHPDFTFDEDAWEQGFWSASLDHAIWFHRPLRADEWHVHDFTSHGFLSSRGLSIGYVFGAGGVHVATVAQEVLLRRRA